MFVRVLAASLVALIATGCAEQQRQTYRAPAATSGGAVRQVLDSKFAEANGGLVIPDSKPDADAVAFAGHCSGGGASVHMGMSECDLIGSKGTPSRVVQGLDQQGGTHNAIWYIESGNRTVYKFDNDALVDIIK